MHNSQQHDIVVVPTVIEAPTISVTTVVDPVADVEVMLGIREEKMGSYAEVVHTLQLDADAVLQARLLKPLKLKTQVTFLLWVALKEARNEGARGGRGGGRGGIGRGGGGGFNRDLGNNEISYGNRGSAGDQGVIAVPDSGKGYERRGGYGGPHGGFCGGRRRGFTNGDAEEGDRPPHRNYERRSGTGRGNDIKREGAGRGNWGTQADEIIQETEVVIEGEKTVDYDILVNEEEKTDEKMENAATEPEEKEPEEITLEEYQKVLAEKRKALESLKTEERKVEVDKELASMQPLSRKKTNDEIFAKLSLSINEFFKPAAGEKQYNSGGRGRGRGGARGGGGGGRYNQGGSSNYAAEAPKNKDPSHFPTLGGK
ncbi:hyaluronan/mRNA-binding protein, Stm1 [Tanacetum coccineum]